MNATATQLQIQFRAVKCVPLTLRDLQIMLGDFKRFGVVPPRPRRCAEPSRNRGCLAGGRSERVPKFWGQVSLASLPSIEVSEPKVYCEAHLTFLFYEYDLTKVNGNIAGRKRATESSESPPRRARGHARVAALLEAAGIEFAEKGYEAATMTAIAARAGASIGSLYQFFPTKDQIAGALLKSYVNMLAETFRKLP
jgi:hypothetical protein